MKSSDRLLGIFPFVDDLVACLKALKKEGYEATSVFSPVRVPELQELMTPRASITRLFTLMGGITGGISLVCLAVFAHLSYRLIVWGKPVLAWVPWVVVAFEGTILFSALSAFIAWVFKAGLPQPVTDAGYDASFSGHKFGVIVAAPQESRQTIEQLLREHGAEEVRDVAA